MKRVRISLGIALAFAFLVSLPASYRSQGVSPTEKAVAADKTLSGQLVKVDTKAKVISVKGADEKEMTFSYTDETQVVSPDKTVQGLSGKTGAQLRISYHEDKGANWATKIELIEKQ